MLPKGNNCSISHGDKRWNSKIACGDVGER